MVSPRERALALPIPPRALAPLAIAALVLLGLGSFLDLPLSEQLYTPNNGLGTLLAAYGEAPALLALVAAGALAWNADAPVHRSLRLLLLIGGGALMVVGTLALVIRPLEMWQLPLVVHLLIALIAASAVVWGVGKISAGASWQAMLLLGAALVLIVAAEMALVQIVKDLWQRPRMRMLVETGAEFSPWWSPGYEEKESLMNAGVAKSEFTSFPSGHTAHATVAVMLAGFGLVNERIRRQRTVFLWIAGAWALFVALSRVTVGAHFLSDTAAAIVITLLCIAVVNLLTGKLLAAGVLDRLIRPPVRPGQPGIDLFRPRHCK